MITIDGETCIGCGECVRVCHNRCANLIDHRVNIDYKLCDRCTQCIAICAQQALSWNRVPPVGYDEARLPSLEQLDELFQERRSIRLFTKDRIARSLLEEVVGCGIYAPTNNHELRAVVVDDVRRMAELEQRVIRFNSRMYRLFIGPRVVYELLSRLVPALNAQVKAKMEERRHDLFGPAAMVFIVGDRRIPFSEASAQAALDYMTFRAQIQGIGSCIWGAGKIVLDSNGAARTHLGLKKREHILGILLLGYSAVRFRNRVEGRKMPIQWNGG